MSRTKLAILASTALCMGAGAARSAEIPVKAPVYKAPVVVSDPWTGFYIGGNVGYSWGKANTTTSLEAFSVGAPFAFDFPGGTDSADLKPRGIIAGGQIGYNWRIAPRWLAGVETDFQWSGQKASKALGFSALTTDCTTGDCTFTNTTDITAKLSWFGTLRGRLGTDWNGLAFYGTGGLAYGRVSVSGTNTFVVIDNGGPTVEYSNTTPFSYSKIKAGWTAGAVIEGVLIKGAPGTQNWTWKIEYLHIDLGSIGGGSFGSAPVLVLNTIKFTDEIVRFGVNYRFAAAPRP